MVKTSNLFNSDIPHYNIRILTKVAIIIVIVIDSHDYSHLGLNKKRSIGSSSKQIAHDKHLPLLALKNSAVYWLNCLSFS